MTTHDARMRWLDWTGCKYLSVVRRLCVMKAVVAAWRDDESCIISLRVLANKWSRVSRKWQYSAPPASCHDDRSWIIPTLDKWNMHTASVRRSNFWCPRNSWVNIINTSHPGTRPGKEKGDYFLWPENYWGQMSNDGVTPGLRGCHLTYLYIPGQYFSARDRITAARGQQSAVITHTYLL